MQCTSQHGTHVAAMKCIPVSRPWRTCQGRCQLQLWLPYNCKALQCRITTYTQTIAMAESSPAGTSLAAVSTPMAATGTLPNCMQDMAKCSQSMSKLAHP